jgi:benzil reductase ((S)-benzoin forming)
LYRSFDKIYKRLKMNVCITGSSRGLGKAFVENYLSRGAKVYGLGRSEVTDKRYRYTQVDISDFDALKKSLKSLLDGVDSLDLLVLNAGILGRIQDISLCTMDQLKKEMDVNMWANKVILDFILDKKIKVKQVIAISSGASVNGSLGWNGYSLSKAALNMLVKLYAAEMRETHLSAIAPGLVKTEMIDSILLGDHDVKRYQSVQSLRDSEKMGLVHSAERIAAKISSLLPRLLQEESGSFIDIRTMA